MSGTTLDGAPATMRELSVLPVEVVRQQMGSRWAKSATGRSTIQEIRAAVIGPPE